MISEGSIPQTLLAQELFKVETVTTWEISPTSTTCKFNHHRQLQISHRNHVWRRSRSRGRFRLPSAPKGGHWGDWKHQGTTQLKYFDIWEQPSWWFAAFQQMELRGCWDPWHLFNVRIPNAKSMEVEGMDGNGKYSTILLDEGNYRKNGGLTRNLFNSDYIQIRAPVYISHSAGRYAQKRFRKANCPIIERLTNSLMMNGRNNGKKLMAVRIVAHAFEIVRSAI